MNQQTPITDAVKAVTAAEQAIRDLEKQYDAARQELVAKLAEAKLSRERLLHNLNGGLVDAGAKVVRVRGLYSSGKEGRRAVVEDAMRYLTEGPVGRLDLRKQYFGTKNYDRWQGQRCDGPYGSGPTHGSVVFGVELTRSAREAEALTPEQTEAALYYLINLEAIQASQLVAAE